jgi:hypothetical protein
VFNILVNHNEDIRRLVEKGYAVAFDSGYMIIRDIPYLDASKQLQIGAIVTKLVFIDKERVRQDDHQVFFAGTFPHNLDGTPIPNLAGGPTTLPLGEATQDVIVQRSFSNKPSDTGTFANFYDKIESYVSIISGPAMQVHDVSPLTFHAVDTVPDSVFKFHDTLTSRAEITDLSAKFRDDVIAIIGLGGTGAYILDFLTKVSVREIRGFDIDLFHVHNAFRSPGRLDARELDKPKADVYSDRYDNFRSGLTLRRKFVDATSSQNLEGVTFAFVCVDKGSSRAGIFDLLLSRGIPFIDVGMGLSRRNNALNGMIRTTYFGAKDGKTVREKGLVELTDKADDLYRTNVQISELNALNACLAVIKYKQLRGFYFEDIPYYQLLIEIGDLKIVGESVL